jgi:hypothetical protein
LMNLAAVVVSLNRQSPIVPFGPIAPQTITFCRYLGTRFTLPARCFDQRRTVLRNSCTEVSSENIVRLQSSSLWQRAYSIRFCLWSSVNIGFLWGKALQWSICLRYRCTVQRETSRPYRQWIFSATSTPVVSLLRRIICPMATDKWHIIRCHFFLLLLRSRLPDVASFFKLYCTLENEMLHMRAMARADRTPLFQWYNIDTCSWFETMILKSPTMLR